VDEVEINVAETHEEAKHTRKIPVILKLTSRNKSVCKSADDCPVLLANYILKLPESLYIHTLYRIFPYPKEC